MNILLVQLPTSHLGSNEIVYPVGLSRLSSLLKTMGVHVSTVDLNLCQDPWHTLKELLLDQKHNAVGLSFRNLDPLGYNISSYLPSLEIAAKLVKATSNALVLAGGPAFSLMPKRFMEKIPQIDIGIAGDGEISLAKLILSNFDPRNVPSTIYRTDSGLVWAKGKEWVSMDEIPPLDLRNLNPSSYLRHNSYVIPMGIEAKRGCDLKCSYCLYPTISGSKVRLRSPKLVVDEIEFLNKEYGIKSIHFTDPILNRPPTHFEEVIKEILRRKLEVSWTGFFREDFLTEYQMELAKEAGLITIYFSGDCAYSKGLKLLNKHLTLETLYKTYSLAAKSNVLTVYHFFVDLPFETQKDRLEMKNFVYKLIELHYPKKNLGAIVFSRLRLYPQAPITNYLVRKNLIPENIEFLYPYYFTNQNNSSIMYELDSLVKQASVFSLLEI